MCVCVAGPVLMSTPAQLVAPILVARGTLSITTSEIYFEVDEEDPGFKRTDPRVGCFTGLRRYFCLITPTVVHQNSPYSLLFHTDYICIRECVDLHFSNALELSTTVSLKMQLNNMIKYKFCYSVGYLS